MYRSNNIKLAVTGGTGFIARGVLEGCAQAGLSCRALSRSTRPSWAGQAIEWLTVPTYDDPSTLMQALVGASYVFHLADDSARKKVRSASDADRNCDALIKAVKSSRIKGVIVASSVYAAKERGEEASSYGAVKRLIERKFLSAADIQAIILRLPPVYGPSGRGGVAALSKLVRKGFPLPLGAAFAPRSYLSRRNLTSLIITMVNAGEDKWRSASGNIFEPSDGVAISTRDLVRSMSVMIGVPPRLFPIPLSLLRAAAAIAGEGELIAGAIDRLDVAPIEELEASFGWSPIENMPESLAFLRENLSHS